MVTSHKYLDDCAFERQKIGLTSYNGDAPHVARMGPLRLIVHRFLHSKKGTHSFKLLVNVLPIALLLLCRLTTCLFSKFCHSINEAPITLSDITMQFARTSDRS